ncbi:tetraacyldisaccharide 4'-kinase [Methyloversatilis thermotolerans]|uniref:tetraacyldisaccharide 4'-kinase n=1 Tax=Methyloversatilis thermotolerans TaxID=1346290 RepID=UPI00047598C9|nr:tetraacyldisaccharide 4'-kinase [Methyloversatilis thermotolerans]
MSSAPSWWRHRGPRAWLLWPLSLLFAAVVRIRRRMFAAGVLRASRLPVPVVVIGNLIAGGAGKTPLTLHLARELSRLGWHPLIVTRGHGGSASSPREVGSSDDAAQCGDEALLLARRSGVPVWTGRARAAAAAAGLAAHPECNVVLCDDGLQHYALVRDIEIVVFDRRGIMNGFHLPAGPLREPMSRLSAVDAVVLNGTAHAPPGGAAVFRMTLHGELFERLDDRSVRCMAEGLAGLRLHAVAGIGEPARFFDHLRMLGLAVVEHPFPDHHAYSAADLEFADCDAILLTEKDAVKCHGLSDIPMWVLPVEAHLDPDLAAVISVRLTEWMNGPPSS